MSSKFRRLLTPFLALILFSFLLLNPWSRPLQAATFTVNSTGDLGDATPGDGICSTEGLDCTLRAAIEEANALFGADAISFNIPGAGVHTISPTSAYPWLTGPVVIDGLTQPGASCAAWPPTLLIELNGASAGASTGLDLSFGTNGSTIRGLVVNGFAGAGIQIANSSDHTLECNFVGTDATGSLAIANNYGMFIQQDSHDNTVGGSAVSQRNLISGNTVQQVTLGNYGSTPYDNVIENNYVGTDVNGTMNLGGGSFGGIDIFGGNTNSILNNLISGNVSEAISVTGDGSRVADGNLIQGNLIGTDANGTSALPNVGGIALGLTGNTNVQNTVIGTDGDGVNDAAEGNVISGNQNAITIEGATANVVAGNYIGTDSTGTAALGNSSETLVLYNGANNNRIGTNGDGVSDALERNIIANSGAEAIWIISGSNNNVVAGNYIGTDVTGTVAMNNPDGISIADSDNNLIGTDGSNDAFNANERNVIAGNLMGVRLSNATNTVVAGNYIGTDATGALALGNVTGIDLGNDGVTVNDLDDADTGSNNLQNFPVLFSTTMAGNLVIDYSLDSTLVNTAYPVTIEFFEADSVGSGEGRVYLGSDTLAGPGSDSVDLGNAAALGIVFGDPIVATATDANGNSSEFSPVAIATGLIFTVNSTSDAVDGNPGNGVCETATPGECTLRAAIEEANLVAGTDSIHFNIPGAGVHTISPAYALPTISDPVFIDGTTQPGASCAAWPPTL
ncbi:MAG: CSLREA domain-containing protein [Chloroflexi bacterium]|nr:CSLREA domain-containing protein [Chloroflexota bacterium]